MENPNEAVAMKDNKRRERQPGNGKVCSLFIVDYAVNSTVSLFWLLGLRVREEKQESRCVIK